MQIEIEKMSNEFTKHHIKGLPFDAVIHHFSAPDKGSAHDHPFLFTTHILSGGYVEEVYKVKKNGKWSRSVLHRYPGTTHTIEATHIHRIIQLMGDECYTLIIPGEKVREPRFWKFNENGSQFRAWYEGDFE